MWCVPLPDVACRNLSWVLKLISISSWMDWRGFLHDIARWKESGSLSPLNHLKDRSQTRNIRWTFMWARNNYFLRQLKLGAFCVTATSITLTHIPTKTVWNGRKRKELPWKYEGAIARRKRTNAGQARTLVIHYSNHHWTPYLCIHLWTIYCRLW